MIILILLILVFIFTLVLEKKGGDEIDVEIPKEYIDSLVFETWESRLLTTKRHKYQQKINFRCIIPKLGQRKLLFTEIEFYTHLIKTNTQKKDIIVVYAGSAPGNHSVHIMEMFPDFKFLYFDPRDFDPKLKRYSNLQMFNTYFDIDLSHKIYSEFRKPENYLAFLSDIRSGSDEDIVLENMLAQAEWCRIIQPDLAMLKFRLGWDDNNLEYFTGDIYPQPRIGATSTETRLWTDCKNTKVYDNRAYEENCFYHNHLIRPATHNIPKKYMINGLCGCYDCWAEYKILLEYCELVSQDPFKLYKTLLSKIDKDQSVDNYPHNLKVSPKDKLYAFFGYTT